MLDYIDTLNPKVFYGIVCIFGVVLWIAACCLERRKPNVSTEVKPHTGIRRDRG